MSCPSMPKTTGSTSGWPSWASSWPPWPTATSRSSTGSRNTGAGRCVRANGDRATAPPAETLPMAIDPSPRLELLVERMIETLPSRPVEVTTVCSDQALVVDIVLRLPKFAGAPMRELTEEQAARIADQVVGDEYYVSILVS